MVGLLRQFADQVVGVGARQALGPALPGAGVNAPIAGVIFAVEVLLAETVVSYFMPLIISSVVGVLCSKIILQESYYLLDFTSTIYKETGQ